MKKFISTSFFRVALILATVTLWYYFLTRNTRTFILLPVVLLFMVPGLILLEQLKIVKEQIHFEHVGLAFGLSFSILAVLGIPFLLIKGNFDYFYYLSLAVSIVVIIYGLYLMVKNFSSSREPVTKNNQTEEHKTEPVALNDVIKRFDLIFCLIVAFDFFIVARYFLGNPFSIIDKIVFTALAIINVIFAAWYYCNKKYFPIIHEKNAENDQIINTVLWLVVFVAITFYSYLALCNPSIDGDDCTYISTALKLIKSHNMNLYEPTLGLELKQLPISLLVMWETFLAFISRITSVPPVELTQYLLYPALYIIAVSSFYYLFLKIFKNKSDALLACVLLLLINVKFIDYHTSLAKFFAMRIHQPKSVVNFIFIPLFLGSFIGYVHERKNEYLAISILLLCSIVSIHPFGMYQSIIPAVMILFGGIHARNTMKTSGIRMIIIMSSLVLVAVIAVFAVNILYPDAFLFLQSFKTANEYYVRMDRFYQSPGKILFLILLPLVFSLCRDIIIRWFLIGTSLLMVILYFCKPTYYLLYALAGPVAWRFVEFIMPVNIVIILILILWKNKINELLLFFRGMKHKARIRKSCAIAASMMLIGLFLLLNSSQHVPLNMKRISTYSRINAADREILEFVQKYKEQKKMSSITVLFPYPMSKCAPMMIDGLITPVSRSSIVRGAYFYNNQCMKGVMVNQYHEKFYKGSLAKTEWEAFSSMFDFNLIIKTPIDLKDFNLMKLFSSKYNPVYHNAKYVVFEKGRINSGFIYNTIKE